jgi:flagellin-like protein
MKKGISPLIATIMLIAFTMVVAGILAGWATQFVTQSRTELQFCARAQLLIQRAFYDKNSGNLTLSIFNTGDVPLKGFSVRLIYQNESVDVEKFNETEIDSQDIDSLVVKTDDTLKQVIVQSLQCRGAQDLMGRYDIQGLGFAPG